MGDIITISYMKSMFDERRLASLVNDGHGAKESIIDDCIDAVESTVYNLLCRQYTLAQLAADQSVKWCCAMMAMCALERRRSDLSPGIASAYEQAREIITRLQEGDAKLSAVATVLPRITHSNAQQVFEKSGMFDGMPLPGDPLPYPDDTTVTE